MTAVVVGAIVAMAYALVGTPLFFKPRGAQRRLFRMAPIHHHFELAGWPEHTILVRFWILNGLAAALALMAADALRAL